MFILTQARNLYSLQVQSSAFIKFSLFTGVRDVLRIPGSSLIVGPFLQLEVSNTELDLSILNVKDENENENK